MLAPFATLLFLSALWLVGLILAEMFADEWGKVATALRGRSRLAQPPIAAPARLRISPRARLERPVRAAPRLRAAA